MGGGRIFIEAFSIWRANRILGLPYQVWIFILDKFLIFVSLHDCDPSLPLNMSIFDIRIFIPGWNPRSEFSTWETSFIPNDNLCVKYVPFFKHVCHLFHREIYVSGNVVFPCSFSLSTYHKTVEFSTSGSRSFLGYGHTVNRRRTWMTEHSKPAEHKIKGTRSFERFFLVSFNFYPSLFVFSICILTSV